MLGDSLVFWAGKERDQLQGGGVVKWRGKRGGHFSDVVSTLVYCLSKKSYPTTIIIHTGTNNILNKRTNKYILRQIIPAMLLSIRNILPLTRIIWSDILPRMSYGEENPGSGAGKRVANFINNQAQKAIHSMGNACFISHKDLFSPPTYRLFRGDGLHLNDAGLIVFRMSFSEALCYFNSHPGAKAFPPPAQ